MLATLFFLSSLGLTYLFSRQQAPTSVVDTVKQPATAPSTTPTLPALPATPATAPAAGDASAGQPVTTAPTQPAPAQDSPAGGQ